MELLNIDSNAKTIKGQRVGYMTAILYLAPYKLSGLNVCPMADVAGCVAACLNTAGRGGMSAGSKTFAAPDGTMVPDNTVQRARIARTRMFIESRDEFMAQLSREIHAFILQARRKGLRPVVRLNGTSDIRWESIGLPATSYRIGRADVAKESAPNIFARFPKVTFYDYTKIPNRRTDGIGNYHLTFSGSGRESFAKYIARAIDADPSRNIAVAFAGPMPETYLGRPVVNGDETDLRFLDVSGVVVGLKAKGRARRDVSGFVVRA